jgi:hypothetical protein
VQNADVLALVQVLLGALVPLLERRVLAAERQAVASEQLEELLRRYLAYSDPAFRDLLQGVFPTDSDVPDVYAEHGSARDLKSQRMEQLAALWYEQHGERLDEERLAEEYERLYTEAEARLNADNPGQGTVQ